MWIRCFNPLTLWNSKYKYSMNIIKENITFWWHLHKRCWKHIMVKEKMISGSVKNKTSSINGRNLWRNIFLVCLIFGIRFIFCPNKYGGAGRVMTYKQVKWIRRVKFNYSSMLFYSLRYKSLGKVMKPSFSCYGLNSRAGWACLPTEDKQSRRKKSLNSKLAWKGMTNVKLSVHRHTTAAMFAVKVMLLRP